MVSSLRVLIADDEPIIRMDLRQMLESLGHRVVAEASDGSAALQQGRELKPDVAILDIKMPGEIDGIEVARALLADRIAPTVLLTAHSEGDLVARAKEAGVFAYLVKPFKEADLDPAMEVAISRYGEFAAVSAEAHELRETLETRKLIERAKGILMDRHGMKEQDAFRRIQVQSMNTRKTMREIAQAIIIASEVEEPSETTGSA
jgi:AmiR/NasT family two-component response regulator